MFLMNVLEAAEPDRQPTSNQPAPRDPAVQLCVDAYLHSLKISREEGRIRFETNKRAEAAYRNAMPDLTSFQNIRDFIACVTQAMVLDIILYKDGTRLLYAAQVAISSLQSQAKAAAKPHTAETPAEPAMTEQARSGKTHTHPPVLGN